MTPGINEKANLDSGNESSLKEFVLNFRAWYRYLLSKWLIILIVGIIGGVAGVVYAFLKKPIYKAELSFALQEDKGGGGLAGAMGLASQFGIDLGGGNIGGEFSGDNLIELMKSRLMIEKALLLPVTINNKSETLADLYINVNNLREDWGDNSQLKSVHFLPNTDRHNFTLTQDSLLGCFYRDIAKNYVSVEKPDKKLSIIYVRVNSKNEFFSKTFTEVLTKVVVDFYVKTKTEKSAKNVAILKQQSDSVKRSLNLSISGVASSIDAAPNANPLLQTLRVPSQRKSVDVSASTAILVELVKNLEMAKMSLLQETPLIQIIDTPIFPLEKDVLSKAKGFVAGSILFGLLMVMGLTVIKVYKKIILHNA